MNPVLARLAGIVLPLTLLALAAAGAGAQETGGESAAERLERALAASPADTGLRLQLAEVYLSQDRVDDAIAQFEAVIELAGEGSDAGREASRRMRYVIATRHAERRELDEAIAIFGGLAREYPDNVLIHYSIGVAYLLRGDLDEARGAFERVIELDPGYINAYIHLATVYERKNDLRRAIGLLEQAVDLAPDSPPGARARTRLDVIEGRLLAGEGNRLEAIAAFERALEAEPTNRDALTELAALHRRGDDAAAELEAYRRITAAYPDDPQSRLRLAELLLAAAHYEEAYGQLETLTAGRPQGAVTARAQQLLGRLRATQEGRRIAEERRLAEVHRLEAHLEADPRDTEAWKELAVLYYQRGDNSGAAQAFEAVRALDPDDRRARYALGAIYDNMGRFADSAREFGAVLELETDEELREQVAATLKVVTAKRLYVEGDFGEATARFEEILAEDPDNDLAHFYLGLIYSQEEQTLRAVDAYQEVIRIVPSHVGARLNLAASYERLNREEDAIDEYAKILQANPSPQIAEVARRAMDNARRRMRGLTANFGYLMTYDDNTNLSASREVEDFRSDLSLNLAYQYKASDQLRWRFLFSPSYSTYHRGQFDYLNTTSTISLGLMRGRYNLVGGYTHRTSASMITSSRIGRMGTVFAEGFTRRKLPPLLRPWAPERIFSNLSATLSYSDFEGTSNRFFSAYTSAAGVSVSQPLTESSQLRAGYQYVVNSNKELVGSDYAYTSHGLSLGMDYRLPWGGVNASYGLTLLDYTNPDSFSQFTRHRRNTRHNVALGATWRFRQDISLFATLSWVGNRSNLPVGFVLSSEDIIEGLQSSSLSDYDRLMATTGMTVSF